MSDDSRVLAAVRRVLVIVSSPEHTGENRCLACTLVNAVGVAIVAGLLSHRRRSLGLLAALVGGTAIWLRGYVLPGTPRFAPRIVEPLPIDIGPDHPDDLDSDSLAAAGPNSLGDEGHAVTNTDPASEPDDDPDADAVDSEPAAEPGDDPVSRNADAGIASEGTATDNAADPEAVMTTLIDADALVAGEETLTLDESFRTALYDRIGELRRDSDEALAERAAAIAGPDIVGEVHDGRVLLAGSRDAWLSRPIALAETAIAELLRERGVAAAVARTAARPIRPFLDTCPACDGPVRDTTLQNCCGGPGGISGNPERAVRACADCDAIVFADRT